ncbi:retrovirus-related pol polyprotein from transposon TNT 1-94 [Tanacetum coccineum]
MVMISGIKAKDWTLLDRQALGVVRISLAKNIAYNVVNENITYNLFKALSNMYEKPSASNKVFLIRQLVNMKMKEGASVADHVNEFNLILSKFMSVDIKFDDEVQALLLLSSLPKSCDKEVNMAAGDYNALVCYDENTTDDRIMDYGALFHATYFREELERFKLRSDKVCLEDYKTLDIAGVGDVVLKTSFGTSWTFKDVRYISGLKKRLISVGKLDEEGYHIGFRDQQRKVTKGSLVVVHGNKRRSLYMVEVPSDGIKAAIDGFCEPCVLGKQKKAHPATMLPLLMTAAGRYELIFLKIKFNTFKKQKATVENETNLQVKCLKSDNGGEYSSKEFIEYYAKNGIKMLKTVKDVARDKLDANSVKCIFIGYGSDEIGYRFWDSKGHKVVRSRDVTFNEDSLYGAMAATYSSNLMKPNQKDQLVLEESLENLANKSIVEEHGLSSEITQSQGGSSDTSKGSKNSGSFKGSGRSDEEDSEYKASFEEKGFETLQVRKSTRESRAPVSDLHEDIYMTQPEGFQSAGKEENLMCKLTKSLYELKQAPRHWYLKFDNFMQRAWYKICVMDHCCYLKKVGSSFIILLLYADDMLVAGFDMEKIRKLKRQLSQEFEMKDLGSAKQILGMFIIKDKMKGNLWLSQEKYIKKFLEKFNMKDVDARCQPLGDHFKLSKKQAPKTEDSRRRMAKVPYSLAVISVMYAMSAIHLAKNLVFHDRTKHIKTRYHYIRELVNEETLSLKKILGEKNLVDILTKVVTIEKLKLSAALTGL